MVTKTHWSLPSWSKVPHHHHTCLPFSNKHTLSTFCILCKCWGHNDQDPLVSVLPGFI